MDSFWRINVWVAVKIVLIPLQQNERFRDWL